ncbi:hypothetical protein [Streptomyces sp. NBC_01614]|uniref:hypothetical protein n=1 Tax=Streptomyces sp. NBC_01614 TaxID=2975897 RepID=UPI0038686199
MTIEPIDLTDTLGEGWSVLLARKPLAEMLEVLGVPGAEQRATDLHEATERAVAGGGESESILLLG